MPAWENLDAPGCVLRERARRAQAPVGWSLTIAGATRYSALQRKPCKTTTKPLICYPPQLDGHAPFNFTPTILSPRMSQATQTVAPPLWQQLQAVALGLGASAQRHLRHRGGGSRAAAFARGCASLVVCRCCVNSGVQQALRSQLAKRATQPCFGRCLAVRRPWRWLGKMKPCALRAPHAGQPSWLRPPNETKSLQAQANFINACLRRFLRERQALVQTTDTICKRCGTTRCGGSSVCNKTTQSIGKAFCKSTTKPHPWPCGSTHKKPLAMQLQASVG